jgi:hypothetical protein
MFWNVSRISQKTSCPCVRGQDPMIRGLICWDAPFGGQPMFGGFFGRKHPCLVEACLVGGGTPHVGGQEMAGHGGESPHVGLFPPMFGGFFVSHLHMRGT